MSTPKLRFYKAVVKHFESYEDGIITTYGITAGTDLADASAHIEAEFGKDLVSITLEPWNDTGILVMPEKILEEVENCESW